mmetsp:Transcript_116083/g.163145  ORF Transcript_116083/g.163145 Transcript_116083/m.163145 type:complete len:134 (+) Transcript_116083:39-440(+)
MQLFISCQQKHLVTVDETTSVAAVQEFIAEREGIPADVTYVTAGGRVLESGTLASHGVQALSTVNVGVRMVGGKVHGSLARAGKVKGQTPKVEPQEKKKKKTGRAKRRIQYNKRFVNVVVGPGKKRGPNSNSE